MRFRNRAEAGRYLADKLNAYAHRADVLVLALPRGGVPVAFEVAAALGAPLDVFLVRKLGVPGHRELAMGAIATGGVRVLNQDVVEAMAIPERAIERVAGEEQQELERRERLYRPTGAKLDVRSRAVIIVDDGLATGSTMRAAVMALRRQHPDRIVVAAPVAAGPTCDELRAEADEAVCAYTPEDFYAVGQWYVDFSEVTDDEIRDLLERAARGNAPAVR